VLSRKFIFFSCVNARSLLEKRDKAFKLIETRPADAPLAVQLFGSVPEEMRDAALVCEARGAVSVDINMGCPVRKVCQVGGGSAMMTALDKTAALVRGMVEAVKIPVTAKMRLGWDDDNLTAPDLSSHFRLRNPPMQHCGHDEPSDPDFLPNCGFWTHDEAALLYTIANSVPRGTWVDIGARLGWTAAHVLTIC
jgi:hypothetical protein